MSLRSLRTVDHWVTKFTTRRFTNTIYLTLTYSEKIRKYLTWKTRDAWFLKIRSSWKALFSCWSKTRLCGIKMKLLPFLKVCQWTWSSSLISFSKSRASKISNFRKPIWRPGQKCSVGTASAKETPKLFTRSHFYTTAWSLKKTRAKVSTPKSSVFKSKRSDFNSPERLLRRVDSLFCFISSPK